MLMHSIIDAALIMLTVLLLGFFGAIAIADEQDYRERVWEHRCATQAIDAGYCYE